MALMFALFYVGSFMMLSCQAYNFSEVTNSIFSEVSNSNFSEMTYSNFSEVTHSYFPEVTDVGIADDNNNNFLPAIFSHPLPNCTPPAIEQFPKPFIGQEMRQKGAVLFHIAVALYMFIGIAIVSDDYFVPACEHMAECLHLSADVAGATFMAAGSSAPELATTIIGVFIAKDDIGLGAVVGSAVFNIMFVIGLCGLFGGMVINLNWWPMTRDSIFYAISIIALTVVIIDGQIHWYEAVSFLVLYSLYLFLMHINPSVEGCMVPRCSCCCPPPVYNKVKALTNSDELRMIVSRPSATDMDDDGELFADDTTEFHTLLPSDGVVGSTGATNGNANKAGNNNVKHVKNAEEGSEGEEEDEKEEEEEKAESVLQWPDGCWAQFRYIICLPMTVAFFLTVPDCRTPRWKRCVILTFLMSCVWISILSYIMVWMIAIIGYTFSIPDTVMGLTFIAAGASVPDAIASLIVAKKGEGDMAVSNAVGSNVFDILLCLGLPWTIQCLYAYPQPIAVYSEGLTFSSITLLLTVLFLLVATRLNSWKLDVKYGIVLMIVYVLFNILTSLYELNIFGTFNAKACTSTY